MERPIMKPIGTPAEELDTPSLVVELSALESNINHFHSRFLDSQGPKLRPHLQSHLSPAIAHMQLRAPGTVGGAAVSTLGQAEIFAQHGIDDILITNLAVTASKVSRAAALAKRIGLTIGADSRRNISDLGTAATSAGSEIAVLIVVRGESDFLGVSPGDAPALAGIVSDTPGLSFAGLMSSNSGSLLDALSNCADEGIESPSAALTLDEITSAPASLAGITEMIAGSYALMDAANLGLMSELRPAARILTTVMTHQDEGLVWLDAGQKATSIDTGLPLVDGISGATVSRMSAEHGGMVLEAGASWDIDLGSKVWLITHSIANNVNVYDFIHATRDCKLEAVWEVSARGRYD